MIGSVKQVEWAVSLKTSFLSEVAGLVAQVNDVTMLDAQRDAYRAAFPAFDAVAIRLKAEAKAANGGRPLGEANPYNALTVRVKAAGIAAMQSLALVWADAQTDAAWWIENRNHLLTRFVQANADTIESAIVAEMNAIVTENS